MPYNNVFSAHYCKEYRKTFIPFNAYLLGTKFIVLNSEKLKKKNGVIWIELVEEEFW